MKHVSLKSMMPACCCLELTIFDPVVGVIQTDSNYIKYLISVEVYECTFISLHVDVRMCLIVMRLIVLCLIVLCLTVFDSTIFCCVCYRV